MVVTSKQGEIPLKLFADNERGNLYVGEAERAIPFLIKRFYIISDIPNRAVVRGADIDSAGANESEPGFKAIPAGYENNRG